MPRVLDRELDRPERLRKRDEGLAGARAQDHVVGAGDAAPNAPAIGGDDLAQPDRARDRGIVELGDTRARTAALNDRTQSARGKRARSGRPGRRS